MKGEITMMETAKRKRIKKLIRRRIKIVKKIKEENNEKTVTIYKKEIKTIEETIIEIRRS